MTDVRPCGTPAPSRRPVRRGRRRRIVVALAALLAAPPLAGVAFQEFAAARDRDALPPPGRLVDVGDGRRMHLRCAGAGGPTILLEGGATAFVAAWDWIQPALARHARVCAYDRAGLGWSDPATGRLDGAHAVERLHTLLARAGERGPFVLVGHSLGGALVRLYADRHPGDVAGLVLIDPAHPDGIERFPAGLVSYYRSVRRWHAVAPLLARFGLLRVVSFHLGPADGLPAPALRAMRAFGTSPRHLAASYGEMAAWERTMDEVRATRPLGRKPLLVLSAAASHALPEALPVILRLHRELAGLSPRGAQRVVPGSTHFTLVTDRRIAATTTAGILEVWRAAGGGAAPGPARGVAAPGVAPGPTTPGRR